MSQPQSDLSTSIFDFDDPGADTPRPGQSLRDVLPSIRGYDLLTVIGSGGMGVVLKARHLELQRVVAIKMLRGACLADEEFRERFKVEAEAIARLNHPNIIQVFAVGTVDPRPGEVHPPPYLSLEYIEGGSLEQHAGSPQPPEFAARVVGKVARAVQVAHQVGVIHRDLKPANVLLTHEGEPKIADFGLAKQLEGGRDAGGRTVTQDGTVVGTPEYMAPEQIVGDPATPAMDIYALGVILYELLTGRLPFQGTTVVETAHQVMYLDPVPPRRLQPAVPRDLETICLKCLAKDPRGRYATAAELADDLDRWAQGRPIRARPVGPVGLAVRWARRNPALAGLSVLLVVVAAAGFLGVFWKWREAEGNAAEAAHQTGEARQSAAGERWKHYRANIVAASSALQLDNVTTARTLLDAAPEEHRNWDWRHFRQCLDSSHFTLPEPPSGFDRVLIAPRRGRVVQVARDGSIRTWDAVERRVVQTLPPTPELGGHMLSPDGSYFVSNMPADALPIRDAETGRVINTLTGDRMFVAPFPTDRRILVMSRDRAVRVWDATTGRDLLAYRGHEREPFVFSVSADGRRVCTFEPGTSVAHVWDAASGRTVSRIEAPPGMAYHWGTLSPTGNWLLSVKGYPEYQVHVWDAETGKPKSVLRGHTNQPTGYVFSPDGSRVATSSFDQTVRVWDAGSGKQLHALKGHRGQVFGVQYSPDGERLVSWGEDRTVRLWDPASGELLATLHGHTGTISGLGYTADGSTIVSVANDGSARLWDARRAEAGDVFRQHTGHVYQVAFHPDGGRVASASWDGLAIVWDATTGEQLQTFDHGSQTIVSSVAFHPDGGLLATAARDGWVRVWDLATGRVRDRWPLWLGSFKDTRLAFSPRGDRLASGSMDGTVHVWDVATGRERVVTHGVTDAVKDVAYSPDGRWLVSAGDSSERTARVWDAESLEPGPVLEGHRPRAGLVTVSVRRR